MQNIFTNIKCSEIILSNANENWYIILVVVVDPLLPDYWGESASVV